MHLIRTVCIFLSVFFMLAGCNSGEPLTAERYSGSDSLIALMEENIASADSLQKVVAIDHSRLGKEAGSEMPPARVLLFSNPVLETGLIKLNPLVAIDLPLRVLAFESEPGGASKVIFNTFGYLESRYKLPQSRELGKQYNRYISKALHGVGMEAVTFFDQETMQPDGIITINSPFDFQTTLEKVQAAIESQDDTVGFGNIDFQQQARAIGEEIAPTTMILFGGPAPGAKAMSKAPTLGLDAFCQKFLIWQDENQQVHLSFNDLLALAERQDVSKSIALRVINYRLNKMFTKALEN